MTLARETKVTLGVASAVALAVGGAAWKVYAALDDVADRLAVIEGDRLGLTRASELAARAALENPGLRVPDPRHPDHVLAVRSEAP